LKEVFFSSSQFFREKAVVPEKAERNSNSVDLPRDTDSSNEVCGFFSSGYDKAIELNLVIYYFINGNFTSSAGPVLVYIRYYTSVCTC